MTHKKRSAGRRDLRPPSSSSSWRRRGAYFAGGASLGGVIGYGIATSGPGPGPLFLEAVTRPLTIGLAVACGSLGAVFTDRLWRRSRWLVIHPHDHNDRV